MSIIILSTPAMSETALLEKQKFSQTETRITAPEHKESERDTFLREAQEAIRAMSEGEIDDVENKMDDLSHVFALNTEELAATRFEPTTEYTSGEEYIKGKQTLANAREVVANRVELALTEDGELPNLQHVFRHPENGILPLLQEYDRAGSEQKERIKRQLKEVAQDAITRLENFPNNLKAKQAIEFIKRLVDVGRMQEKRQTAPRKKERESSPLLRETTQGEFIESVKRFDPNVAAIIKNQLDLVAAEKSADRRQRQLNVLKRRLETMVSGGKRQQIEETIDLIASLITQEKEYAQQ